MNRTQKNDSILFMLEGSPFKGGVTNLTKDPNCAPYGVVIEMVSKKPPKEGAQCWLVSAREKISGNIKHVRATADCYLFDMVLVIPDPEFWN